MFASLFMCTMKTLRMVTGRTYFKIRDRAIFVKLFSSTSAAVVVVVWSGSPRPGPPELPFSLLHHVPRKVLSSDTQLTVNLSHAWPPVVNLSSSCICFLCLAKKCHVGTCAYFSCSKRGLASSPKLVGVCCHSSGIVCPRQQGRKCPGGAVTPRVSPRSISL